MLDFSESYGFDNQYLLQKTTQLNSWCFSIRATLKSARKTRKSMGKIRSNGLNPFSAGFFRSEAFDWNGLHKKQPMRSTIFWFNAALRKKPSLPAGFLLQNQSVMFASVLLQNPS